MTAKDLLRRSWFRTAAGALALAAAVYGMVYADVLLRARSAYLEGERYMAWHGDPDAKKAWFEERRKERAEELRKAYEAGEMDRIEYEERLELARFERDHAVEESSVKYAYLWYQTCVELFSPPESRWVRLSREKMAEAKELWKAELEAAGIPFEDYMLE